MTRSRVLPVLTVLLLAAIASLLAPFPAHAATIVYPVGIPDASEPSAMAPPGPTALSGYAQTYTTDFTGTQIDPGWNTYQGQPGGDPGALFAATHVVESGGVLRINTFRDPAYAGAWATGGVCQCAAGQTYGAYFVRSRLTGPGPTGVELLWPDTNVWPPEIDFSETGGGVGASTATVHWGTTNRQQQSHVSVDMTAWHTWGVLWTPSLITYTLDGSVWGTVSNAAQIPTVSMHLSLQSQTWCQSGWACPTSSQSMIVDWVSEYTRTPTPSSAPTTTMTPPIRPVPVLAVARPLRRDAATVFWALHRRGVSRVDVSTFQGRDCHRRWRSASVSYDALRNVTSGVVTSTGAGLYSSGPYSVYVTVTSRGARYRSVCVALSPNRPVRHSFERRTGA